MSSRRARFSHKTNNKRFSGGHMRQRCRDGPYPVRRPGQHRGGGAFHDQYMPCEEEQQCVPSDFMCPIDYEEPDTMLSPSDLVAKAINEAAWNNNNRGGRSKIRQRPPLDDLVQIGGYRGRGNPHLRYPTRSFHGPYEAGPRPSPWGQHINRFQNKDSSQGYWDHPPQCTNVGESRSADDREERSNDTRKTVCTDRKEDTPPRESSPREAIQPDVVSSTTSPSKAAVSKQVADSSSSQKTPRKPSPDKDGRRVMKKFDYGHKSTACPLEAVCKGTENSPRTAETTGPETEENKDTTGQEEEAMQLMQTPVSRFPQPWEDPTVTLRTYKAPSPPMDSTNSGQNTSSNTEKDVEPSRDSPENLDGNANIVGKNHDGLEQSDELGKQIPQTGDQPLAVPLSCFGQIPRCGYDCSDISWADMDARLRQTDEPDDKADEPPRCHSSPDKKRMMHRRPLYQRGPLIAEANNKGSSVSDIRALEEMTPPGSSATDQLESKDGIPLLGGASTDKVQKPPINEVPLLERSSSDDDNIQVDVLDISRLKHSKLDEEKVLKNCREALFLTKTMEKLKGLPEAPCPAGSVRGTGDGAEFLLATPGAPVMDELGSQLEENKPAVVCHGLQCDSRPKRAEETSQTPVSSRTDKDEEQQRSRAERMKTIQNAADRSRLANQYSRNKPVVSPMAGSVRDPVAIINAAGAFDSSIAAKIKESSETEDVLNESKTKKRSRGEPAPHLLGTWSSVSHIRHLATSDDVTPFEFRTPPSAGCGTGYTPPSGNQDMKFTGRWSQLTSSSSTGPYDKLDCVRWQSWKDKFLTRYKNCRVPFIDTHCHIDFIFDRSNFTGSYEKYCSTNADTYPHNYAGCVAVFCNPRSFSAEGGLWKDLLQSDRVWGAVGCHPKNAADFTDKNYVSMLGMVRHPKVMAVGEIGLDYSGIFHKFAKVQKEVFIRHLKVAKEIDKPIVIHCRDAEQDCLDIMEQEVDRNHRIHRHCFTGSWAEASNLLDKFPNLYIGLTPLVTWIGSERASGMREVAARIPLERLVLETDAPYFIPRRVPRDEMPLSHPGMAITVADEVAMIRGLTIDNVLEQCLRNSKRLYGIYQQI